MLRQGAINGAVSLEWVPASDLSGIERAVLVPIKSISFRYDKTEDRYLPTQYISQGNQYIDLNELTYYYFPLETSDNSPYGIPPFVAALGNTIIQLYMMDNLKFVMKKIGMLGLVDAVLKTPPANIGETDAAYQTRMLSYLNDFAKNFSENYRDGISAHFDSAEIKMQSVGADVRGAKDLLQMNEEQIFSGLKTDPAMKGRTYSTTETYAGIVYAKMIKQLSFYQRLCKRAIEKGYKLHLLLNNISVDISCTFNPNPTFKPIDDATADQIKTDTVITKMDAGIIGPDDAARELGYEKAYGGGFEADSGGQDEQGDATEGDDSEMGSYDNGPLLAIFAFSEGRYKLKKLNRKNDPIRISLKGKKRERPKPDEEGKLERRRQRWVNKYNGDILTVDSWALASVAEEIKNRLSALSGLPAEEFAQEIYAIVKELHPAGLARLGLATAVKENMRQIYEFYRARDAVVSGRRIPTNLNLIDRRAIDFLSGLDDFHISKYITKPSIRKRMLNFLKEEHLSGNTAKPDSFISAFSKDLKNLSKSQVRRITDTSVTRIRTWGHIRQMAEARMKTAEISEVMDSVTCPTCRAMNGKTFRVGVADAKIQELCSLTPEEFQRRVYDNAPSDWKDDPAGFAEDKSAEQMIALDLLPPFHPNCRGRTIYRS